MPHALEAQSLTTGRPGSLAPHFRVWIWEETKAGTPSPGHSHHSLLASLNKSGALDPHTLPGSHPSIDLDVADRPFSPCLPTPTSSRSFIVCAPEHPRSPSQHLCRCLTLAQLPVSLSHPKFTAQTWLAFPWSLPPPPPLACSSLQPTG